MSVASEPFDLAALKLRSRRRRWLGRYALAAIGLGVVVFWLAVMALAPLIAPYSYRAVDLVNHLLPPSFSHPMGTDELGRDVLSRVIWGARISLPTGFVVVAIGSVIGVLYGAVAAFVGGKIEEAMMRVTDLFLCFPPSSWPWPSPPPSASAGPTPSSPWWSSGGRNTPGSAAAWSWSSARSNMSRRRGSWASARRASCCAISCPIPWGPLTTLVTLDVGNALITFAGLGFLGLGVVPPAPEWGAMVSEGRSLILQWWVSVFPGLAIFSVVMGFNFLGDGIRDWLDPRAKRR